MGLLVKHEKDGEYNEKGDGEGDSSCSWGQPHEREQRALALS